MKQTTDTGIDLMSQRFKLIADYPTNTLTVGTVINNEAYFHICVQYPHLFKKLEWWEERTFSRLPEYIKWTSPGSNDISFFKVHNWYSSPNDGQFAGVDVEIGRLFIKDCIPATEIEFENYLKSKS